MSASEPTPDQDDDHGPIVTDPIPDSPPNTDDNAENRDDDHGPIVTEPLPDDPSDT